MRSYLRITTLMMVAMMLQSVLCPGGIALAQETRAETIAQQQEKKSATLTPEAPTRAEHIFLETKRRFIDTREGFYPLLGSIYAGGGLALGGGYRRYYGDRTFWSAAGLWSIKNYKLAEVTTIKVSSSRVVPFAAGAAARSKIRFERAKSSWRAGA